jgi:hypothetical protein
VSDVVYLYGFVPADSPAPPPSLAGLAGRPVELLAAGPVRAVIARLPADEYGAEQVTAGLEDMAWVGEHGLAHERVVLWFVDHGDILPARLFTLHSGTQSLLDSVAPALPGIAARLQAMAGRREWNLKVAYDRDELARHGAEVSPDVRRLDDDIAAAAPGRRYLLERRRADLLRTEVGRAAQRMAAELLDHLADGADDARVLPLAAADGGGTVVLNAALLVRRDAEPDWRPRAETFIDRYRQLGMVVTLSGPWAPYRFLEPHADA